MTIGGIRIVRLLGGNGSGSLFMSLSDSPLERTANWLGEKNEVEAPPGADGGPRFLFGRWAG